MLNHPVQGLNLTLPGRLLLSLILLYLGLIGFYSLHTPELLDIFAALTAKSRVIRNRGTAIRTTHMLPLLLFSHYTILRHPISTALDKNTA